MNSIWTNWNRTSSIWTSDFPTVCSTRNCAVVCSTAPQPVSGHFSVAAILAAPQPVAGHFSVAAILMAPSAMTAGFRGVAESFVPRAGNY